MVRSKSVINRKDDTILDLLCPPSRINLVAERALGYEATAMDVDDQIIKSFPVAFVEQLSSL